MISPPHNIREAPQFQPLDPSLVLTPNIILPSNLHSQRAFIITRQENGVVAPQNSTTADHVEVVRVEQSCTPHISCSINSTSLKIFTGILMYVQTKFVESVFPPLHVRDSRGRKLPKSLGVGMTLVRINHKLAQNVWYLRPN
jgi:hypothetical protein